MPRRRRCRNFLWRDEDSAYQAERENDRIVFHKIRREQLKNRKTAKIIRGLFLSPLWVPRMRGKSAESWRRKYNGWRKSGTLCKRKNRRQRPANTARNANTKSFIGKRHDDTRVRKARVESAALLPRPDAERERILLRQGYGGQEGNAP